MKCRYRNYRKQLLPLELEKQRENVEVIKTDSLMTVSQEIKSWDSEVSRRATEGAAAAWLSLRRQMRWVLQMQEINCRCCQDERNYCCSGTDMSRMQNEKEQVLFPASCFAFCLLCTVLAGSQMAKKKCGLQNSSSRITKKTRKEWV